jgi:hypothetical protein
MLLNCFVGSCRSKRWFCDEAGTAASLAAFIEGPPLTVAYFNELELDARVREILVQSVV